MKEQRCNICGSELYLTINFNEIFCPNCNGIKPLDRTKSAEICKKIIIDTEKNIEATCTCFSQDYLIELACNLREVRIKEEKKRITIYHINQLLEGTVLIKKVLEGNYGIIGVNKNFLKYLSNYLNILIDLRRNMRFVQENYGSFFEYSDFLKEKAVEWFYIAENNKFYAFFPNTHWLYYKKNLEEYGISSPTNFSQMEKKILLSQKIDNLRLQRTKRRHKDKYKPKNAYKLLRGFYNALYYISIDPEMFSFEEINNNEEVLKFLKDMYIIADKIVSQSPNNNLAIISKTNFFNLADKFNYDSQKLYEIFVSSKSSIKNFPIIIEHNDHLLLGPDTLFLVNGFLEYKFNKDVANNLLTGHDFEDEVKEKLEKLNFSTKDPKNENLFLKNRKIKINGNKREIDLIAYDEFTIWVIECKDQNLWNLSSKLNLQKNYRIKDLKKEIDLKHRDRIQFVKDNYKNHFGFKKDYKVKGLLITRIKENIDEYNNVKIICRYELEHLIELK